LDAAIARAERERKLASDFQAPTYLPAEWNSAEADYRSIQADRTSTATAQASERRYSAAADRYHGIFQNSVSLYAADITNKLLESRNLLIAGGIEDLAPEYLDIADQVILDAEDSYLADDYYTAQARALEGLDRYRTLGIALEGYEVREELIAAGIEDLAPEYLDIADEAALDLEDAYYAPRYQGMEGDTLEVLDRYRTIRIALEGYEVREEVIAAGIDDLVGPEYLDIADDAALDLEDAYYAAEYHKLESEALKILDRYRTLRVALEGYEAREEVIAAGIDDLAPEYMDIADNAALDLDDAYFAAEYRMLETDTLKVLDRYRTLMVVLAGYGVREDVIAGGIDDLGPEYLDIADGAALDLEDVYYSSNYHYLEGDALKVLDRYRTLRVALEGYGVREDVIAGGIDDLAPEYLDIADDAALDLDDVYYSAEYRMLEEDALKVLDRYRTLRVALEGYGVREEVIAGGIDDLSPEYLDIADDAALDLDDAYYAADYHYLEGDALKILDRYLTLRVALEGYGVREEVIAGGIDDLGPEYLDIADDAALDLDDAYFAADYHYLEPDALKILDRYRTLRVALAGYEVREEVIAEGIDDLAPEYLDIADDAALDLDDVYFAAEYRMLEPDALKVLDRYRTLRVGLEGYGVREEVIAGGIDDLAPEYLDIADDAALDLDDVYYAAEYRYLEEDALKVLDRYRTLRVGLEGYGVREEVIAGGIDDLAPEYLDIADDAALDLDDGYYASEYRYLEGDALKVLDRYRSLRVALEGYKVREEVIAAGIDDLAPEYLDIADDAALDLDDAYYAAEYRMLEADTLKVLDQYLTLKVGLEAYAVREEVVQRDFASFDRDSFNRADETLLAAADSYEAGAVSNALNGAGESKAIYTGILGTGWTAYSSQLRTLAQRERQNAMEAKANVAVRDDFSRIDQTYNQAESAYGSGAYDNAADLYARAESGFVEVILAAEAKRRVALAALDNVERKLVESESTALNAERFLEGGAE
jgi:hypothetical protein